MTKPKTIAREELINPKIVFVVIRAFENTFSIITYLHKYLAQLELEYFPLSQMTNRTNLLIKIFSNLFLPKSHLG